MANKTKQKLETVFDNDGNFKTPFNPYHHNRDHPYWSFLFDEDGNLNFEFVGLLRQFLNSSKCHWDCDASKLYHADCFASNTKNSYSTIYYWR